MTPNPTQSNVIAALRNFLLAVLPDGVEVVPGQQNRRPEPRGTDFVVTTPIRLDRLRTNIDSSEDVRFTGSIAGTAMTVSAVSFGAIEAGATLFGTGVAAGTKVVSGPGGVGSYVVSVSQTLTSRVLSSGAKSVEQGTEVTVQLDFHSASLSGAADMAQVVSTLLRDEYGTDQFANQNPNYGVTPLHADDPRQMPFWNDQQQVEWRWVLEACLQVNPIVSVPQQYADVVEVELIDVDAVYPPA